MKTKKMRSNTFCIEQVKPRNEDLHNARFASKAGRQVAKTDFSRAREKQKHIKGLY